MVSATMGRVMTEATIESLKDLWDVERGQLTADKAKRVTVSDALVDTGATLLSMPTKLIQQLGLKKNWPEARHQQFRRRRSSNVGSRSPDDSRPIVHDGRDGGAGHGAGIDRPIAAG